MPRTAIPWLLAALVVVTLRPSTGQHFLTNDYAGHWWQAAVPDERSGFISGYLDCYLWEYKGPARYSHRSLKALGDLVSEYYERHQAQLSASVTSVLLRFRDLPGDPATMPSGREVYSEPHGFYDGNYWRQVTAAERLGFVEGYLSCHAQEAHARGGAFTRTPGTYVVLISQWYHLDDVTGATDPEREWDKIADALFQVRLALVKRGG